MCDTGLHALHIDKCLNMKCDSINSFKQEIPVDNEIWMDCLSHLHANLDLGPEQPKAVVAALINSLSKESEECNLKLTDEGQAASVVLRS